MELKIFTSITEANRFLKEAEPSSIIDWKVTPSNITDKPVFVFLIGN